MSVAGRSFVTETDIATAVKFIAAGKTWVWIGERIGINYMTLKHQFKVRGLVYPVRRRIPAKFNVPRRVADLAYIAGIIDGEGCITKSVAKQHWCVSVYQSDKRLIDWLLKFGGYSGTRDANKAALYARGIRTNSDLYYWNLANARDVRRLLRALLPYLLLKRDRALQAIDEISRKLTASN